MAIDEQAHGSLRLLLEEDPKAYDYYRSLHPSVRARLDGDEISSAEELIGRANERMRDALIDYGGIYDDSDSWPNGPEEF
ncbi:MAG: hypothetical protein GX592_06365 [Clostridiales bacterium]|nr:hypothetical protein [Clostridiales bacterium]